MLFQLAGLEGHTHGDSLEAGLLQSGQQQVCRLRLGEGAVPGAVPGGALPLPLSQLLREDPHGAAQDPHAVVRVAVEMRVWRPLLADL